MRSYSQIHNSGAEGFQCFSVPIISAKRFSQPYALHTWKMHLTFGVSGFSKGVPHKFSAKISSENFRSMQVVITETFENRLFEKF